MRILVAASVVVVVVVVVAAGVAFAQRAAAPATDMTKGTYVSAAAVAAAVAKLPNEPMGSVPLLKIGQYNVNIEHRRNLQTASVHDKDAELFYVIDGSATLVTGGTLIDGVRTGDNLRGKGIQGGTPQKMSKGDFMMVPAGVAHWFTEIQGTVTEMSVHLPVK